MTCALRERCAPARHSSATDRLRRKARWNGWRSAMNGSSARRAPSSATTATKRSVVGQLVKLLATWRIPRQAALRAGYQPARSRGSAFPTARGLRFLGGLGTLAVFRPALLLRRRDALARRRAQDALATGWLRRRGRGRRNGFAFQRGLNLPDLFFDPLFLNLIAHQGHL